MPRAVLPTEQVETEGEEGERKVGQEAGVPAGDGVPEISRQEPQAGAELRPGLLRAIPLPEVALTFEGKLGVESAPLGAVEGGPLAGAATLEEREEADRDQRHHYQDGEAAPAPSRREVDQDRQAEQREEGVGRQQRAEQEPRRRQDGEMTSIPAVERAQALPGEERKEDAGHQEDRGLHPEGECEGGRGEEEAGQEERRGGELLRRPSRAPRPPWRGRAPC